MDYPMAFHRASPNVDTVFEMSEEVGSHGRQKESIEEGTKEGAADLDRQRSHSRSLWRR